MHLYELSDKYLLLVNAIENNEVEDEQFQQTLAEIKDGFEDKAENIGKLYLSIQANQAVIQSEIDRLSSKKQAIGHRADSLKNYLLREMIAVNTDKIKRDLLTISVRANPPSVYVVDEDSIPADYRHIIPESWQPDKKQIIDHFKSTGEIIQGVEIISDKKNLVIK